MYLATEHRWLRAVTLQHGRRAPHSSQADLWCRPIHIAGRQCGRSPSGVTRTTPHETLFRVRMSGESPAQISAADRIPLTTSSRFSPRLGPGYLISPRPARGESIWKFAYGASTELWRGKGARVFGGPSISPDGQSVAFSVQQNRKALLYVMRADGTKAHILADSLDLQGSPAWPPNGESLSATAARTSWLSTRPISSIRPRPQIQHLF